MLRALNRPLLLRRMSRMTGNVNTNNNVVDKLTTIKLTSEQIYSEAPMKILTTKGYRVAHFAIFEKLVFAITSKISRTSTGHIYSICSLEYELSFCCICSVRILSNFEVIVKTSFSKMRNPALGMVDIAPKKSRSFEHKNFNTFASPMCFFSICSSAF